MTQKITKKEFNFESGKTVETYNSLQQLIELADYDIEGNLTMRCHYSYDKNGNNIERIITDQKDRQIRSLRLEYDPQGREIKYEEFDANNALVHYCLYEHDQKDGKIKARWFDKNGKIIKEGLENSI